MQRANPQEYVIERGQTETLRQKALEVRAASFRNGAEDRDGFDDIAEHLVISKEGVGPIAACRLLAFDTGADIKRGYTAQFYDVSNLAGIDAPCLEVGRFCTRPDHPDLNLIRLSWGAIAEAVSVHRAVFLFGCSSFKGTNPADIHDALAFLRDRYLAPKEHAPLPKAPETYDFTGVPHLADRRAALSVLPPLLTTYLRMGGWVSDHLVIDRDLGTMHVFTGVEVEKVPETRSRSIRKASGV